MVGEGLIAASTSSDGSTSFAVFIVVVVVAVVILVRRHHAQNHTKGVERLRLAVQKVGASPCFAIGLGVAGVGPSGIRALACAATSRSLLFFPNYMPNENPGDPTQPAPTLASIPIRAIERLSVADASQAHQQVVQRLSVTRMALLGPLSLAAPKRKTIQSRTSKFVLTIEWRDGGVRQSSSFVFANAALANAAEERVRQALKPRTSGVEAGENEDLEEIEVNHPDNVQWRWTGEDWEFQGADGAWYVSDGPDEYEQRRSKAAEPDTASEPEGEVSNERLGRLSRRANVTPILQGLGVTVTEGQAVRAAPSSPVTPSVADELTKLAQLLDAGVLTEEEFAAQKAKLLG
jgi:hypothetical protein